MNYLEELEKLRRKVWIKTIISFFIFFLIFILFFSRSLELLRSGFIIFILGGMFFVKLITSKDIRKYRKIYKKNIILENFKNVFTNIKYDSEAELSKDVISNIHMMNTGDRYSSNDYISAKYKEINFECADVHIEDRYTDSDGKTRYSTIFRGQWMIFDFNKNFKANIQICEKSFRGAKRGGLFIDEVYKKIKMEDVDFNKKFTIYAENELDAFYVLTPNMMEKIKKLDDELQGNLLFCLVDSKMHVGLHNRKDLFEPNVYKKINLEEEKENILKDIKIITEFVDMLDLDNDLFKRRD